MIPLAYIQAWSQHAPWPNLRQVEQDFIISGALCDLFASPALIKGDPWKLTDQAIEELRAGKYPTPLTT